MEVNINQAVKYFFSNSSFEMVYIEAVANAVDALATNIEIAINLSDKKQISNLSVKITDNGVGFDDGRFAKFSKLLDVEENTHKGLGRLVYLSYFNSILVNSTFKTVNKRVFEFSENFNGTSTVSSIDKTSNGSELLMQGFRGRKLHDNKYLNPLYIKKIILENFYLKLYKDKLDGKNITITIKSTIEGYSVMAALGIQPE